MHNILYKMFLFLFLFLSMLLLCSFFILKELFFSFLESTKNLGRSDDAKRRKKEDGLSIKKKHAPYIPN